MMAQLFRNKSHAMKSRADEDSTVSGDRHLDQLPASTDQLPASTDGQSASILKNQSTSMHLNIDVDEINNGSDNILKSSKPAGAASSMSTYIGGAVSRRIKDLESLKAEVKAYRRARNMQSSSSSSSSIPGSIHQGAKNSVLSSFFADGTTTSTSVYFWEDCSLLNICRFLLLVTLVLYVLPMGIALFGVLARGGLSTESPYSAEYSNQKDRMEGVTEKLKEEVEEANRQGSPTTRGLWYWNPSIIAMIYAIPFSLFCLFYLRNRHSRRRASEDEAESGRGVSLLMDGLDVDHHNQHQGREQERQEGTVGQHQAASSSFPPLDGMFGTNHLFSRNSGMNSVFGAGRNEGSSNEHEQDPLGDVDPGFDYTPMRD